MYKVAKTKLFWISWRFKWAWSLRKRGQRYINRIEDSLCHKRTWVFFGEEKNIWSNLRVIMNIISYRQWFKTFILSHCYIQIIMTTALKKPCNIIWSLRLRHRNWRLFFIFMNCIPFASERSWGNLQSKTTWYLCLKQKISLNQCRKVNKSTEVRIYLDPKKETSIS